MWKWTQYRSEFQGLKNLWVSSPALTAVAVARDNWTWILSINVSINSLKSSIWEILVARPRVGAGAKL